MSGKIKAFLAISYLVVFGLGAGLGIYILPILTAKPNATIAQVQDVAKRAVYQGQFSKDQEGSDAVHWAEGKLFVAPDGIAFEGNVAPGPDYKIYFTKEQAHNAKEFLAMKDQAVLIHDLHNFGNFAKPIPSSFDVNEYTTVQIWCEAFSKFIGSAKYR